MTSDEYEVVRLLEPKVFADTRGYFFELWSERRGIEPRKFVQDNLSFSSKKHTFRGLHFQWPHPQAKLVTVLRGTVLDYVVDVRVDSPRFKSFECFELSADSSRQLYIPPGFAHGFLTLTDDVIFHYKCDEFYYPADDKTLYFKDADIGLSLPSGEIEFSLSDKDARARMLKDFASEELPRMGPHA